jgi:hypothetical protein
MKKTAIAAIAFIVALTAAPVVAFADHYPISSNVFNPLILNGPLLLCSGAGGGDTGGGAVDYPACSNLCDLVAQIANVIYYAIAVVIWIITPILVAVGGIMIMLGGANPEMVGRGKKTITGAVWGIAIVLLAWLIIFTFVGAMGNLSKYVGGFGGSNGKAACSITGS